MKKLTIETDGVKAEVMAAEYTTKKELELIMRALVKYINEHPLP